MFENVRRQKERNVIFHDKYQEWTFILIGTYEGKNAVIAVKLYADGTKSIRIQKGHELIRDFYRIHENHPVFQKLKETDESKRRKDIWKA